MYTVSALCPPMGTAIAIYSVAKFANAIYSDLRENDDKKLVSDVLRQVVSTSIENMGLSAAAQFVAPSIQMEQNVSTTANAIPGEILTVSSKSLLVSSAVNLTDLAVKVALSYD